MKELLRKNIFFLIPYTVFLLFGGLIITLFSKEDVHLFINSHHYQTADTLFQYITYLGDGLIVPIITIIVIFFWSYRYALIIGISYSISSIITQLLKRTVFSDSHRPVKFFENIHDLYLVPGIENHIYNSFPSGHATTAFSVYLSMALISKNKYIKLFLFLFAFMVSFSRIYLSQHFINDIYAGSLIGTIVAVLVFYFFENSKKMNSLSWIDDSLLKRRNS